MRKEFTVKNATFVYDNSVKVMKKTFEYDGFESQSYNDINDYTDTQAAKGSIVTGLISLGAMIHIIFTLVSLIISCIISFNFLQTNLFTCIFFPFSGILLISVVIECILIKKEIITDGNLSYFENVNAQMRKIDNLLYRKFDNVKTFELVQNMYEDSSSTGWILMITSVNPDEAPLFDNIPRNFKFADAESYHPGDNIEINCIDRTISVRK